MDCTNCAQKGNVYNTTVPMVVLENQRAHDAVTIRRMIRVIVLLIVLLVGSNALWVWRDSQFMDVSVEQEVDTGDGDAFVVGNGDLNYGEGETESNETSP